LKLKILNLCLREAKILLCSLLLFLKINMNPDLHFFLCTYKVLIPRIWNEVMPTLIHCPIVSMVAQVLSPHKVWLIAASNKERDESRQKRLAHENTNAGMDLSPSPRTLEQSRQEAKTTPRQPSQGHPSIHPYGRGSEDCPGQ